MIILFGVQVWWALVRTWNKGLVVHATLRDGPITSKSFHVIVLVHWYLKSSQAERDKILLVLL